MQEIATAAITVLIALAAAIYLTPRLIKLYAQAGINRKNYKGREITPALGSVIPLALIPALAWLSLWQAGSGLMTAIPVTANLNRPVLLLAIITTGMCMAGLLDDILNENTRGIRAHLRSLSRGKLTSGMIKALWGTTLTLLVVLQMENIFPSSPDYLPVLTLGGSPVYTFITEKAAALLIILLWTNGLNLLDRRPGRALKSFMFLGVILAFAGAALNANEIILLLPLLVIALVLLPPDLAGEAMLGDAGSNPLGAALGLCALLILPFTGWLIFLLLGVILNLAGELVSLTKVIDSNRFLSLLDRLGSEK